MRSKGDRGGKGSKGVKGKYTYGQHQRCSGTFPLLPLPPELPLLPSSEWRVAAAGGKGAAAASGLLFAADGGADQIFDGVGGGFVPLLGERTASCPAC